MFVIGSAQRKILTAAVRAPFHRRILAFLRASIPERLEGLSESQILDQIAAADLRATSRGLQTERGISQFAALSFLIRPTFDEIPEIRDYLLLDHPDPDTKVDALVKTLAVYKRKEQERGFPDARIAEDG